LERRYRHERDKGRKGQDERLKYETSYYPLNFNVCFTPAPIIRGTYGT
jgi:hypothetical protein